MTARARRASPSTAARCAAGSAAVTARLWALATEGNATLFMVSLAAFLVQLRAYSGRDDLQVGSGVANRRDPGVGGMIGMPSTRSRCASTSPATRPCASSCRGCDGWRSTPTRTPTPRSTPSSSGSSRRATRRSPLIQTLFSFHDAPR